MEVALLLIGAGGQRLLFQNRITPLHCAAIDCHVDVSRLLVEIGSKRLLAAKAFDGETAEDTATRCGHRALAGMLRRAHVAKAWSDVWGQARSCVSAEVEALAAARAAAAMAELLAEEAAKPGGAAGSAGGSGGRGAARGSKGKGRGGPARTNEGLGSVHQHDGLGRSVLVWQILLKLQLV